MGGGFMVRLSPEEQLKKMGKTKSELETEIMDTLIQLYSHQMGVEYEYHEITPEDKTA